MKADEGKKKGEWRWRIEIELRNLQYPLDAMEGCDWLEAVIKP